jgi:ABC-type sugar transport system ATPase subunit
MSSLRNVVLSTLRRYRTVGIVNQSAADKTARSALARLRTHGRLEQTVLSLSGGSQQKVLFARIIEQNARISMLDEPTKGVDVSAKSDTDRARPAGFMTPSGHPKYVRETW